MTETSDLDVKLYENHKYPVEGVYCTVIGFIGLIGACAPAVIKICQIPPMLPEIQNGDVNSLNLVIFRRNPSFLVDI